MPLVANLFVDTWFVTPSKNQITPMKKSLQESQEYYSEESNNRKNLGRNPLRNSGGNRWKLWKKYQEESRKEKEKFQHNSRKKSFETSKKYRKNPSRNLKEIWSTWQNFKKKKSTRESWSNPQKNLGRNKDKSREKTREESMKQSRKNCYVIK